MYLRGMSNQKASQIDNQGVCHRKIRLAQVITPIDYMDLSNFSRHVLLLLGWALFLFSCVTVYQKSKASKIYDPFEVLGISPVSKPKAKV